MLGGYIYCQFKLFVSSIYYYLILIFNNTKKVLVLPTHSPSTSSQ